MTETCTTLDNWLPPGLRECYTLRWGVAPKGGYIVSLDAWEREAWERGWDEYLISYPLLDEAGHFSPVMLDEAIISAIADLRAHQGMP